MDKVKILFLTADPSDAARLRLGQELRDIREKLQLSKHRDNFSLDSRESVRPEDLTQAIFDVEPQIIHFSGHGLGTGELCFESDSGKTQSVSLDALSTLFELVADRVGCVILNACYSEIQAKAIAEHIPFVIGMSQSIGDKAAIAFAIGFYKALGAGSSVEEAYKFGCFEIQVQNIPEHSTPVFYGKKTQATPKLSPFTVQSFSIEDNLRSDKGIDYCGLRDLLKAGKWREANETTLNVMLQIARRKNHGYLEYNHVRKLPHTDMCTINDLWVKYSNGRFGFSVQKNIYLTFCKKANRAYVCYEDDAWKKLGDAVKWRVNEKWIWHSEASFDISAPQGHLPILFPKITEPLEQACLVSSMSGYYNAPKDTFYTSPYSFAVFCRSDF
ncbi:MAG: GUN4 domain-containing protein [Drouetiella hepatica Uher 2000/2452]|jgi:hypothetical protein|uniref:GUN4 domain-containing protein n=1 Tax=Drouetiella hepatica Uher 2000/2452 TaxID=904376 RepID=A0A951UQ66_9CYAN|nr:GUN4 domain-containing protein [Drouetiella hepatica Uher 2000/2452]